MSGTRSHSPRAPATDALIVAHGRPSDIEAGELAVARMAAAVTAELAQGWAVGGATLAAPGALERAADHLRPGAPVVPLFMADGWFVDRELPRRLDRRRVTLLPPLGLYRDLPNLARRRVRARIAARGWMPSQCHVLLVAHGSGRSRRPAELAHDFARKMVRRLHGPAVRVAFLEQSPRLEPAARDLPATSICLPFFAADGQHVSEDIPEALTGAGFRGELLPPVGLMRDVPALIAAALRAATGHEAAA